MKIDLERFNASQREAICHNTGPALVLAGPGSGKTTVITNRLLYLTAYYHIPPEEILVVTFTKAAAVEMQQRFEALVKASLPIQFGTFHAIYYRILRESHPNNSLTLLKEKEKQEYMRQILRQEQISADFGAAFLEITGKLKNGSLLSEIALPESISAEQTIKVFKKYRQLCGERKKLDFDDMAYECLMLLEKRKDILKKWQGKCRYILADEYQDIAPIQEKILSLLALPDNNLFLVGDDDQAIYGFRGAGTEIMLSFPQKYTGTKQIFLEKNYRCRPGIIRAAEKVISENEVRFEKKQVPDRECSGEKEVIYRGFMDREAENREIVRQLRAFQRQGILSETAVLYRRHMDGEALIGALDKAGIPRVIAGRECDVRNHFVTRDIHAYLRLIHGDMTRKNFYLIMNRPWRGIEREGCTGECFRFSQLQSSHIYDKDVINRIQKLEQDCMRAEKLSLYAAVMYIRKGIGYENWITREYTGGALEEAVRAMKYIQELAGEMSGMEDWERWLQKERDENNKIKKGVEKRVGKEGVHLLTYHGSKGLEFDHVIMPDLNEGTVPHKKALSVKEIEEERRMFYVGMTRAKERLYLYFRTGTKEEPETMSRFLHVFGTDQ